MNLSVFLVLSAAVFPYLSQIRADLAQPYATGRGVTVAVIDTGIDLAHPAFAATQTDTLDADVRDTCDHGTGTAGIVAAIAPDASLLIIKVYDCAGGEHLSLAAGVRKAVDNGADIINLSIGLPGDGESNREAVAYAVSRGVLVVAAAGNYANGEPYYPAAYPAVVGVGGVDGDNRLWSRSNWGYSDVVAPAAAVYAPSVGGGWNYHFGTSMAAPQVAGVAALVWQVNPDLSAGEVAGLIGLTARDLGEPGEDALYGRGLVDAFAAVTVGKPRLYLARVEAQ